MQKIRVAVTGLGTVNPLGNDTKTTWQALLNKKSGVATIKSFDASTFGTNIAAEVKNFTLDKKFSTKHTKYNLSFTKFALQAADEALNDAGIRPTAATAKNWGIVTGSGMMTAEFEYLHRFQQHIAPFGDIDWKLIQKDTQKFYELTDFGKTISNSGLALLVQYFGIEGYANSVHTACASGGQALGLAMQAIRRGDADYILAGGYDSMINPLGLSSFCLLGALSTDNTTPQQASRPFDATRNGFVLGEGAAFLILENFDKAIARKAKIYAELVGEGNSLSAYRITDSPPNGDGAKDAIAQALADAKLSVEDISYINAHGTSTKMNDLSETNAIKAIFKDQAYKIPVSSTKSQTGHLIAAAGAIEAVFSVLAIDNDQIPMTMNLKKADPDCDLDYVVEDVRRLKVNTVMSNSFGFGGSNSSLIFKKPDH